jgi:DNA-directed RNA polymerase subunit RPC12/RpoP
MTIKQNLRIWKELNDIELERAAYLINSDELIFETLDESIEDESGRLTKSLHKGVLEEIKILQSINSPNEFLQSQFVVDDMTLFRQYKCPTCKQEISITRAEFIKGIAMTSCGDCSSNGVTMDDVL